jgi:hypothetical protein
METIKDKPNPLTAYRELESITTSILSACERGEIDAVLAEIGRREEAQGRLEALDAADLGQFREDILPILEKVKDLDREIEPKLRQLLTKTGEKLHSVSNSKKLLDFYLKQPHSLDAKFLDRRG